MWLQSINCPSNPHKHHALHHCSHLGHVVDENSLSALIICLITDYTCSFFQSINQKVLLPSMFSVTVVFDNLYTASDLNLLLLYGSFVHKGLI